MINTKFEESLVVKTQASNSASLGDSPHQNSEYLKAKIRISRSPLCNLLNNRKINTNVKTSSEN